MLQNRHPFGACFSVQNQPLSLRKVMGKSIMELCSWGLCMKKNSLVGKVFFDSRFYYCLLVLVFVFFVLITALVSRNLGKNIETQVIDYESGWVKEDGSAVDFSSLMSNGKVRIYKEMDADSVGNGNLCFYTKNVYFTVYMGNEMIYDFHPKAPVIFGKAYGVFPHVVTIPNNTGDDVLSIELENIYLKTEGKIEELTINNGVYYIVREMQKSIPLMMLCVLAFSFGLVYFIIGITGKGFGDTRYEIMSMGAFSVVSSLWIASEGTFLSCLFGLPVAIHFIDYMMIAMLPIPTVLFAAYITGNNRTKVGLIVALLAAINILTQIILTSLGIKDYHELLVVSHIILALTIAFVIYLFIRSIVTKKVKKGLIVILSITFLVPLVFGVFEMIRYRINPSLYYGSSNYRYVIFLFIFMCGIYEFINMSDMSRKSRYAEVMEKMAYTDALTGLKNRKAYNNAVEAMKGSDETYTMVMLDMNHLKAVNDKLGHLVGDEYIKKLSEYIQMVFGEDKSFRMGGDEFLIMSKRASSDPVFHDHLAQLNRKIEEFNQENKQTVPLSVAIGYAVYRSSQDNLEEIIRKADENMYKQKKTMKMELGLHEER